MLVFVDVGVGVAPAVPVCVGVCVGERVAVAEFVGVIVTEDVFV